MDEKIVLLNIGEQIINELQSKPSLTCGLMGGDLGKIMYLYECSKIERYMEQKADMILDRLFGTYRNRPYMMTYCNGLAGFGIGLQLLENRGYVQGASCQMNEFDSRLYYALRYYLLEGNIDFLHGATGLGFYFFERMKYSEKLSKESLQLYVDRLCETVVEDNLEDLKIKWVFDRNTAIKRYNISLSHGISSIAILLSKIVESECDSALTVKCVRLLYGIKNYLLSQIIDFEEYGSFFPTFPKECMDKAGKSRLGWCYGDLGIIFALMHIGKAINDGTLVNKALDMAKKCAVMRRDVIGNMIYDACICHGASGVVQAFKSLYNTYRCEEFKDAYFYWRSETLKMCYKIDRMYEFRNYDVANKRLRITNSFLDGNSGVGMMLIGADTVLNKILLYDL